MYDKELVLEILRQIKAAADKILQRFQGIENPEFFVNSVAGNEKLDAICMQLIVLGEDLKNLDKVTNKELLAQYPQIDWRGAKAMRDVISHDYSNIDAEAVYFVCKEKVQPLKYTIEKIISDINQ